MSIDPFVTPAFSQQAAPPPPVVNFSRKRPASGSGEIRFFEKRPDIGISGIVINGVSYPTAALGDGNTHITYSFTADQELVLGDTTYRTSTLVLKLLRPEILGDIKKVKSLSAIIILDRRGYEYAKESVRVAEWIIHPEMFVDTVNPSNGLFWVQEKAVRSTESVVAGWAGDRSVFTLEEVQLVTYVQALMTRSISAGKQLVCDFYPRNVMYRTDGAIVAVDAEPPEGDEDQFSLTYDLFSELLAWSNTNKNVFNKLIEKFPKEWKVLMKTQLQEQIVKNGGTMPTSHVKD